MFVDEDYLAHEGVAHDENPPGRGSGRFAWGSGKNPHQRQAFGVPMIKDLYEKGYGDDEIVKTFKNLGYTDLDIYDRMKDYGKKDADIAKMLHLTHSKLKDKISIRSNMRRMELKLKIWELHDHGTDGTPWSNTRIAEHLGITEGTVRNYLKSHISKRENELMRVTNSLKEMVDKKRFLDVGPGGEDYFGVASTRFNTAVTMLEEQGYHRWVVYFDQISGNQKQLTVQVLCPPDVTYKEMQANKDKFQSVKDYITENNPETNRLGLRPPVSISSDRIFVRYGDQGGSDRDGTIQLKRGVEDLGLGSNMYAQVRIAVDGTHYLKGMAIYADPSEFPPGKDIIFNTNKASGTPWMLDDPEAKQVFKHLTNDPDNPFKAAIKVKDGKVVGQWDYEGSDGKMHQSPINIINSEEDWSKWSRSTPSQFLINQDRPVIKEQLKQAYETKRDEFEDIKMMENPTVRKYLLEQYAPMLDTAAVKLRGAPFAGQGTFVILPVPSLKKNEIYAPMYDHGTRVVTIRYPHQGAFEIVEATVNNKNREAKSFMNNAQDAVGIPPSTAKQMSGADFDGDNTIVIPTYTPDGKPINKIKVEKAIKELMDFDPNSFERQYDENGNPDNSWKRITKTYQNKMMGVATNLLTDMKVQGAETEEIIRAVKFCYVIIDSEKHDLNWQLAKKVYGIDDLRKKYQGHRNEKTHRWNYGASTIITRAKSETRVDVYNEISPDKNTGEKRYQDTPAMRAEWHKDENGKTVIDGYVPKTRTVPLMSTVSDARELMSGPNHVGNEKERLYADFANSMKALANEVRREMVNTKGIERDPDAAKKYAEQVASLNEKLARANANTPKERLATIIYNNIVKTKRAEIYAEYPNISKTDLNKEMKKVRRLAATYSRNLVGAKKEKVDITDKEWEAIQAHAISHSKLLEILKNADADKVKQRAMPKDLEYLTESQKAKIKALAASNKNLTNAEIAKIIGCSASSVVRYK